MQETLSFKINHFLEDPWLWIQRSYARITKRVHNQARVDCRTSMVFKYHHAWKIRELRKVNKRCRVLPHKMTHAQALRRVDVCCQLLDQRFGYWYIERIVRRDENGLFPRNSDCRHLWWIPATFQNNCLNLEWSSTRRRLYGGSGLLWISSRRFRHQRRRILA